MVREASIRAEERCPPCLGAKALLYEDPAFETVPVAIVVRSPAFCPGGALPDRFTAAGAGVSPAISWRGVPPGAASVVLLVEGADSPASAPLVHVLVTGLPPADATVDAGRLGDENGRTHLPGIGLNSLLQRRWLPPAGAPAQGPQRCAFQVFALDCVPALGGVPARPALRAAMDGHVLARGLLLATFERP